jgi:negative regulator of sigma E activity
VSKGPNAWVAGGATAALLLLWVLATGDAIAARQTPPSDPEAMRLLRDAAAAARTTSYEGTQFRAAWAAGSVSRSQLRVAHATGDGTVVHTGYSAAHHDDFQPDAGLTGLTQKMLDLLMHNYSVVRAADARICGRPARVVEARRTDGSVAGRFWLDRDTGLMLYRELVDAYGAPVTVTGFSALSLTGRISPRTPRSGRGVPLARLRRSTDDQPAIASPWGHELIDAELGTLRGGGWTVPPSLPGRLTLFAARRSDPDAVVQLAYSDGLSTVSVFIQRGDLDERRFAGWRKRTLHGSPLFERNSLQRWAVWASRGYVYTVLADAPASTTESVVTALPHGGSGFWARPARGLSRLGSWLNPFD